MFEQLCAYKQEHGNCQVSYLDEELARWVKKQRRELFRLLKEYDELSKSSTASPTTITHQNGKEEENVFCPPLGVITIQGLGPLIPSIKLSLDRIKHLESIGFEWKEEKRKFEKKSGEHQTERYSQREENWNNMLERLCAYKAEFGDCYVPQHYPQDPQLGIWVMSVRQEMVLLLRSCRLISRRTKKANAQIEVVVSHVTSLSIKVGKFTPERLQDLKLVGFEWVGRKSISLKRAKSFEGNGVPSTRLAKKPRTETPTKSGKYDDNDMICHKSSLTLSNPSNSASALISCDGSSRI
uniref:Helicase-associated domain-containing protein n=1 Tax=Ditylum brightwellii TaxID=49249 RepID=A0A7S4RDW9_9STRA